jgi:hypothetical protein
MLLRTAVRSSVSAPPTSRIAPPFCAWLLIRYESRITVTPPLM